MCTQAEYGQPGIFDIFVSFCFSTSQTNLSLSFPISQAGQERKTCEGYVKRCKKEGARDGEVWKGKETIIYQNINSQYSRDSVGLFYGFDSYLVFFGPSLTPKMVQEVY